MPAEINIIFSVIGILLLGGIFAIISNSTVERIPKRQSIVYPEPYCKDCATQYSFKDIIPIYSFLKNKGACPYCNAPMVKRIYYLDIAEMTWVLLFILIKGWSWIGLLQLIFGMGLIAIMAIEIEKRQVTDQILFHLGTLGIIYRLAFSQADFPNAAISMGIGVAIMLFYNFIKIIFKVNKKINFTEIKLGGVLGLFMGFPYILLTLYSGIFFGAAYGAIRIKFLKKNSDSALSGFSSSLAFGAIFITLFGNFLVETYSNLIGLL